MGKKVFKTLLIAGAIITGAGLLIAPAFAAGFAGLAHALVFVQKVALLGGISSLLTPGLPTIDASRQLAENLNIFSNPLATRGIPLGEFVVAGQILFRENIENGGDTPDELLLILGLAGYPATSLTKFWLNGELITSTETTTGPGAITTGKFANDLWVWFRTGEETTAAFPDIATLSATWNARTRKLRGIPAIGLRVKVTEKLDGKLEPLAQIKGAKLYDPRLDSTVPGGSGTHRIDDQTTWEFPSNSTKLAELAYLVGGKVEGVRIFGMGKTAAAIDLENFASEQNICEEQVNVVGGGTIDRYTLNGLLIPKPEHRPNLQQLLSASAGTMDASGGIYRTFAGAWRASSMTLTEEDIDAAPTDIQLQKDQSEEINVISGSFADPNDRGQVKEYPQLRDETSITNLGENSTTLDLPFTNDHRIAQRISKIQMKRLNAARLFAANYWLRTLSLQPGDIVTQTYTRYNISAETFRIALWGVEASEDRDGARRLTVPMQLVEEKQAWFDWDETTEEQTLSSVGTAPLMDQRPAVIGDRQATAISETVEGTGLLSSGISAGDGSGYRSVARGQDPGFANDGDAVTFGVSWTNTPTVRFMSGGRAFSNTLTGDQELDFAALNLSGSGFTAKLKIKEETGATTTHTDNTISTPSSPTGLDHSINKSQTAEAHDDKYKFHYDVSFTGPIGEPLDGTIGFYTNDGAGWVQRATKMHTGDSGDPDLTNQQRIVTVDGLGLDDDFGITKESGVHTFTFNSTNGVKYDTATAPVTEAATPPGIEYLVIGG